MNDGLKWADRAGKLYSFTAAALLAACVWIVELSPAMAQDSAGQGWKQGQEQIEGDTMVVAAYMALWVILLLFVVRIASRQRALKADIEELRKTIEDGTP